MQSCVSGVSLGAVLLLCAIVLLRLPARAAGQPDEQDVPGVSVEDPSSGTARSNAAQ